MLGMLCMHIVCDACMQMHIDACVLCMHLQVLQNAIHVMIYLLAVIHACDNTHSCML